MRPTSRIPLLALIVALVVGLASPAGAATSSSRRSSRSADPGAASDADLDHAVQAVNGQVKNEEVRAEAAQQALDAAIAQEQTADAQVAAGAAKVAQMRTAVMDRAVESYIHPEAVDTTSVVKLSDLAEISRRAALFDEVAKRDRETLDQLIATKSDLVANQQIAARARSLADQRRQLEAQTLIELKQAQADRQRLQGVLQARITEYQQEADAVGAEETNLSNLIRSKQAPAAPASRGPDPDAGGNGRTSSSGLIWPVAGPVTSATAGAACTPDWTSASASARRSTPPRPAP